MLTNSKRITDVIESKIVSVTNIFDYWQIQTDKCVINIYNPIEHEIKGTQLLFREMPNDDLSGLPITNILLKPEYVIIEVNTKYRIYISLRDDDYNGPEAMGIQFDSGEILVIN